jgi:hypothetical protein
VGYAHQYFGASKHSYTFALQNPGEPDALPWQGGVVAFAKYAPKPLFFAEAHVLHGFVLTHPVWRQLEKEHHTTLVYFHVENDEKARQTILADLIEAYRPVWNDRATPE